MSDRPRFVAIIMDGNARWARGQGLSVTEGHRAGTDALKRAIKLAGEFELEQLTARHTALTVFVGFDYGGRAEILHAAERYRGGGEDEFSRHLYAPELEDPEQIIRTGGELRLSNFLLWEAAYSELYFSDRLWPDFDREEFERALDAFGAREYRYGGR